MLDTPPSIPLEQMNVAQLMRECLIHLMNRIPDAEMPRDQAFWKAQGETVVLRTRFQACYNSQPWGKKSTLSPVPFEDIIRVAIDRLKAGESVDAITASTNGDLLQSARRRSAKR